MSKKPSQKRQEKIQDKDDFKHRGFVEFGKSKQNMNRD